MTEDEKTRVEAVLTTLIAPLVAKDGGTVRLVGIDGDAITVALEGAYQGCPGRPIIRDHYLIPLLSKELGRPITVSLD